jgi:GTP cyclohydrolase II
MSSPSVLFRDSQMASEQALRVLARAQLPTRLGEFEIFSFTSANGPIDDVAITTTHRRFSQRATVGVRVHSECLTGEAFSSLRCDCHEQLHTALSRLRDGQLGLILYLRQEGRGIGIANKVRAYSLQDEGLDTLEANRYLGFDDDLRDYEVAAEMLRALRIKAVDLHTNNPLKIAGLSRYGIQVKSRVPIVIAPNAENRRYLDTKMKKSGHLINLAGEAPPRTVAHTRCGREK